MVRAELIHADMSDSRGHPTHQKMVQREGGRFQILFRIVGKPLFHKGIQLNISIHILPALDLFLEQHRLPVKLLLYLFRGHSGSGLPCGAFHNLLAAGIIPGGYPYTVRVTALLDCRHYRRLHYTIHVSAPASFYKSVFA